MLETLLAQYGYPLLIIGTFLEGETILVLGGVVAHLGYLSLDWVIACGFCGSFCGDQLYAYLGRRHGKAILQRYSSWQARAQRVLNLLERNQTLLILGFRFLYGLRTVTPFAIGMSNVPTLRFTLLNMIGAAIWAIAIALAGFYFGRAVEALIGDIKHYEIEFIVAIVGIAAILWLIRFFRQRHSNGTDS